MDNCHQHQWGRSKPQPHSDVGVGNQKQPSTLHGSILWLWPRLGLSHRLRDRGFGLDRRIANAPDVLWVDHNTVTLGERRKNGQKVHSREYMGSATPRRVLGVLRRVLGVHGYTDSATLTRG